MSSPKISGVEDQSIEKAIDEKHVDTATVVSINSEDVDEALELVGTRRTVQFSEEFNNKLRRKLVRISLYYMSFNTTLFFRILPSPRYVLLYISHNFCMGALSLAYIQDKSIHISTF